jgi:hypothetical protein
MIFVYFTFSDTQSVKAIDSFVTFRKNPVTDSDLT